MLFGFTIPKSVPRLNLNNKYTQVYNKYLFIVHYNIHLLSEKKLFILTKQLNYRRFRLLLYAALLVPLLLLL